MTNEQIMAIRDLTEARRVMTLMDADLKTRTEQLAGVTRRMRELEVDYKICKHSLEQLKHDLILKNAQIESVKEWICHNGGLLNEWAADWNPAKHPPLTQFIRGRLDAAMKEST